MSMQPLMIEQLERITEKYLIRYDKLEPLVENEVRTRMSKEFSVPKRILYDLIADLGHHDRFLPHLKRLVVIDNDQLGGVLGNDRVLVVESLEEGGSKVGFKLYTLDPPNKITGQLVTDPFRDQDNPAMYHPKKGIIEWKFGEVGEAKSTLTVESSFVPNNQDFYVREMVDHVWLNFFENLMVEFHELDRSDMLTKVVV